MHGLGELLELCFDLRSLVLSPTAERSDMVRHTLISYHIPYFLTGGGGGEET